MLGHSLPRMAIQPPLPTQESHPVSSTLTFLFSPGLYTTREDSCLTERKRLIRMTASQCPGYTASHGKLDLQKPYCRDDHQTSILCWDGALFFLMECSILGHIDSTYSFAILDALSSWVYTEL